MQFLFMPVLLAICQGLVTEAVLPTPKLLGLTALDPPGLQVEWELVEDLLSGDPIKGYQILVWELRPVRVSAYGTENGDDIWTVEYRPPKLSDAGNLSEDDAKKIVVSDPQISKAQVPNIKLNFMYEVRVRAFTESKYGPLSSHLSIQLLDSKHTFGKAKNVKKRP